MRDKVLFICKDSDSIDDYSQRFQDELDIYTAESFVDADRIMYTNNIKYVFTDLSVHNEWKENLRSLLNKRKDKWVVAEADGGSLKVRIMSERMAQLLGISAESFENFNWKNIISQIHVRDREKTVANVKKLYNMEVTIKYDFRFKDVKTGNYVWIYAECQSIRQRDGSVLVFINYIDITEQQKIDGGIPGSTEDEKLLQGSINSLIANSPAGVLQLMVKDGKVTPNYISKGFCNLLGYSLFELYDILTYNFNYFVHNDDLKDIYNKELQLMKERESSTAQLRLIHRDGHSIWVQVNCNLVHSDTEDDLYFLTYTKISELKETEEKLRQINHSLKAILTFASVDYFEYDVITGKCLIGDNTSNFYHIPSKLQDLVESVENSTLINNEDKPKVLEMLKEIKGGKRITHCEIRMKNKVTGETNWIRFSVSTIFDDHGNPIKAISAGVRIDELKKIEDRFKWTIAQNNISAWILDIPTKTAYAIDGPLQKNFFGREVYKLENVPQISIDMNRIYPDDLDTYMDMYQRIYNGEKYITRELRIWSEKNGNYTWHSYTFTVIEEINGKSLKAFVSARDITSEKILENQYHEEVRYRNSIDENLLITCRLNMTKIMVEEISPGVILQNCNYDFDNISVDYRKRISRFLEDINLSAEDNEDLSIAGLRKSYKMGITNVRKKFRARMKNTKELIWVVVDCHIMERPETGELMAFYYSKDITDKYLIGKMGSILFDYTYEIYAVISSTSGCCKTIFNKRHDKVESNFCSSYEELIEKYVKRYLPESEAKKALVQLKLSNITSKLKKCNRFVVNFNEIQLNGSLRGKQLIFINIEEEVIGVIRKDVQDIVEIESKHQQELANSRMHKKLMQREQRLTYCMNRLETGDDFRQSMEDVLGETIDYFTADRAYIFSYDYNNKTISNTFERCSPGVKPKIDTLQNLPIEIGDVFTRFFEEGDVLNIGSMDTERDHKLWEIYDIIERNNVARLMVVPISYDGKLHGFLGVDNPKENINDVDFLVNLTHFASYEFKNLRLTEKLMKLSYKDILTGFRNRNSYNELLKYSEENEMKNVGTAFIDMNGLKIINDSMGHSYGDKTLVFLSEIIKKYFSEDNVYRISGDEFVIVTCNINFEEFQNIIGTMEKEMFDEHDSIASVGAIWCASSDNLNQQICRAEDKMYICKQNYYDAHGGKKHINKRMFSIFNEQMLSGTFEVYLQPQADLITGKIFGAEALIRKFDEKGKLVFPYEFIPALEKERKISRLDFFVFKRVCQLLKSWREKGITDRVISVNLSRITMMEENFELQVLAICEKYFVNPGNIEFEITESEKSIDNHRITILVQQLRSYGFRIAIDDMGTDYSSLSLFTLEGIHMIKMDRSFIMNLETSKKTKILTKSLINLAHDLDLKILAEGVENEAQKKLLCDMGCDYMQGYILDKAVSIEEFEGKYLM